MNNMENINWEAALAGAVNKANAVTGIGRTDLTEKDIVFPRTFDNVDTSHFDEDYFIEKKGYSHR